MTQRNPLNERYNTSSDEKRTGKTRKSSASAKPKAQRAATVREPAPKTAKQKKAEAKERERKAAEKNSVLLARFEETEGYKRLRRMWWAALGGAIACTVISFITQRNEELNALSLVLMIVAYVLIIIAFYIDLGKIRKERKIFNAALVNDKSKEARKEQKKIRAEMREQEKEAAEKRESAEAEEPEKKKGLFGLFGKDKKDDGATEDASKADSSATETPATHEEEDSKAK